VHRRRCCSSAATRISSQAPWPSTALQTSRSSTATSPGTHATPPVSPWGAIGPAKQKLARKEIGGTPETAAAAYAERSPISYAAKIAASCVPLQIWWSRTDATVLDPEQQSGRMYRALATRRPQASVDEYVGRWKHMDAMRVETDLPKMLAGLGLLPERFAVERLDAEHHAVAGTGCTSA
jgi:hypothetical protein